MPFTFKLSHRPRPPVANATTLYAPHNTPCVVPCRLQ